MGEWERSKVLAPDLHCPGCGYKLDATTKASGGPQEPPDPGDVSICWGCGSVMLYQATLVGLTLRMPSLEEQDSLLEDPLVRSIWYQWYQATHREQER